MLLPFNDKIIKLYFQKLRKPLQLELKNGCADNAISGPYGLSLYVKDWSLSAPSGTEQIARGLVESFQNYASLDLSDRRKIVESAINICEDNEERDCNVLATKDITKIIPQKINKTVKEGCEFVTPSYVIKQVAVQNFLDNSDISTILCASLDKLYPRAFWHKKLKEKFGITTVYDLLYHFPLDNEPLLNIKDAVIGERITFIATVISRNALPINSKNDKINKPLFLYTLVVEDDSDSRVEITSVTTASIYDGFSPTKMLFNSGDRVMVFAKVETYNKFQYIDIYAITQREENELNAKKVVPKYPLTEGVYQSQLRRTIFLLLSRLKQEPNFDYLPGEIIQGNGLCNFVTAISALHQPVNDLILESAEERIIFDEFLPQQLKLAYKKLKRDSANSVAIKLPELYCEEDIIKKLFLFDLTNSQRKAIFEILNDLADDSPMNRLLEGDVGSGKTAVAIAALCFTALSGYQTAIMAPTEVLAEQLYFKISEAVEKFNISTVLLTGSVSNVEKKNIINNIKLGIAQVVVGTHAIIQDSVEFLKLGLAIIDEEHRFGVNQREKLRCKNGSPDEVNYLIMTATPIPRTLAITDYGDYDITMLLDMPSGRHQINTDWFLDSQLDEVYDIIESELSSGRQGYMVCPIIEGSAMLAAEAAYDTFLVMKKRFAAFNVGLLHGRMDFFERNEIMEDFRSGKINLLVTTTIIEVGVDVSNATVIAVMNADRFGLSQLHQLRGRVGRSAYESHCLLIINPKNNPDLTTDSPDDPVARKRIKAILTNYDGFELARLDLQFRGHGEIDGTKQSGNSEFRFASISEHEDILRKVQSCAQGIIAVDPEMENNKYRLLKKLLE